MTRVMGVAIAYESGLRLNQIERFLLGMPDVLAASAWVSDGSTLASVTLSDQSDLTPKSIQRECMEELGLHMTPRHVLVELSRPIAA